MGPTAQKYWEADLEDLQLLIRERGSMRRDKCRAKCLNILKRLDLEKPLEAEKDSQRSTIRLSDFPLEARKSYDRYYSSKTLQDYIIERTGEAGRNKCRRTCVKMIMLLDQGKWQVEPATLRYLDHYNYSGVVYSVPDLREYIQLQNQMGDSSDGKCIVSCERKLAHLDTALPCGPALYAFSKEYKAYSIDALQEFVREYTSQPNYSKSRLCCERMLLRFDWAQLVDLASNSHPKSQPIQLLRRFLLEYQRYSTPELRDFIREKTGDYSYDKCRLSCERKVMVLERGFLQDLATAPEPLNYEPDELRKLFRKYERYSTEELQEYIGVGGEVNRLICERMLTRFDRSVNLAAAFSLQRQRLSLSDFGNFAGELGYDQLLSKHLQDFTGERTGKYNRCRITCERELFLFDKELSKGTSTALDNLRKYATLDYENQDLYTTQDLQIFTAQRTGDKQRRGRLACERMLLHLDASRVFRFLDLSPEIRNLVYEMLPLSAYNDEIKVSNRYPSARYGSDWRNYSTISKCDNPRSTSASVSLLRVCKKINKEATGYIYDGTVSYITSSQKSTATTKKQRWISPSHSHPRSSMRNITVFILHCCDPEGGGETQAANLVKHHTFKDRLPLRSLKVVLNSACSVHFGNNTQAIEKVFAELKRVLAKETEVYLYNFGAELENAARVALASGSASET